MGLQTIQDGALALLGETCEILNNTKTEYIIVGGWSPFLLNSGNFPHPGTKDVDILFKSGTNEGELENLINEFLGNGFTQSAKHPFQLLKKIQLNHHEFMFNIDLLHPNDQEKEPQMFVDHIDFPVKESHTMRVNYSGKTIILPQSDFFFTDFCHKHSEKIEFADGSKKSIEFNLLNEAGLILSKTKSVFNAKRTRDAYDILLAIHQSRDYDETIRQINKIATTQPQIFSALEKIYSPKNLELFNKNCHEWFDKVNVVVEDREINKILSKFFDDLKITIREDKE